MSDCVKTVGLLLIGGKHHILHLIPIAAGLSLQKNIEVMIFVTQPEERELCADVLTDLGVSDFHIRVLRPAKFLRFVSPKLAALLSFKANLKRLDALIVAERTSTLLRYFTRRLPVFVHIPHGAGDRAKSYDRRIRHFDHVLVAGAKDKRRMLELGLVSESTCHVTGYIKTCAVGRLNLKPPQLFENDAPVVLYNPHFSVGLSSWHDFGRDLLTRFAATPDMNFIFAPHIRLFKAISNEHRAAIKEFAKYPNIHCDPGSVLSTNMTYTRIADIYLGDVSSQVYEFLSSPKPCVFLGRSDTEWRDNPDYAHWNYGRVCYDADETMIALRTAKVDHQHYADTQKAGCLAATGDPDWNPIARAAKIVSTLLK